MKLNTVFSPEELRGWLVPSDIRGWQAVLFDWAVIVLAFSLAGAWPHPATILIALILIGGRQLALAILVHETAHSTLFKTRKLNDWVGKWICGAPVWQDLHRYRKHHLKHHQFVGTVDDPDMSLVAPFPVTGRSLYRKFLRDLVGLTGIKRIYGLLMMDLGFLSYTIAADPKPVPQEGRKTSDILRQAWTYVSPVFLTQLILFSSLSWIGKPWLYLLWVGAYLSPFSCFLRIRSIAEHACTKMSRDPLLNTRTTHAHWIARMTVAPHRVNFHLEHHLIMTVPYFKLPEFHRVLKTKGLLEHAFLAQGYVEVLKIASTRP